MRPATFFAGVLLIAVCVAGTIVKLAKPEAWNWFFDHDTRNILPPQYLIQFPRGYAMGGQFYGNYDDDPKHRDYADQWVMAVDPANPPLIHIYQPDRSGTAVRIPFKVRGGPFSTYRNLRYALTQHHLARIKLDQSVEVVEANIPQR